jgi:hypothetical protein
MLTTGSNDAHQESLGPICRIGTHTHTHTHTHIHTYIHTWRPTNARMRPSPSQHGVQGVAVQLLEDIDNEVRHNVAERVQADQDVVADVWQVSDVAGEEQLCGREAGEDKRRVAVKVHCASSLQHPEEKREGLQG